MHPIKTGKFSSAAHASKTRVVAFVSIAGMFLLGLLYIHQSSMDPMIARDALPNDPDYEIVGPPKQSKGVQPHGDEAYRQFSLYDADYMPSSYRAVDKHNKDLPFPVNLDDIAIAVKFDHIAAQRVKHSNGHVPPAVQKHRFHQR